MKKEKIVYTGSGPVNIPGVPGTFENGKATEVDAELAKTLLNDGSGRFKKYSYRGGDTTTEKKIERKPYKKSTKRR